MKTTEINKYWLCWSHRQNAFHIETIATGVKINRVAFKANSKPDHIPIGIFATAKEANDEAERLTPVIKERDEKRGQP